jgi:hypothetical protein
MNTPMARFAAGSVARNSPVERKMRMSKLTMGLLIAAIFMGIVCVGGSVLSANLAASYIRSEMAGQVAKSYGVAQLVLAQQAVSRSQCRFLNELRKGTCYAELIP